MSGPSLAAEMREAALDIQRAAQRTRCYSVIQHIVTAATEHISAAAGNAEKNERITELESERDELRDLVAIYQAAANDADADTAKVEAERDALRKMLEPFGEIATSFDYMPAGSIIVVHISIDLPRAAHSLLSEGGGE